MASTASTNPFVPRPFKVVQTRREIGDVVTLDLAPVSGVRPGVAPSFLPGQFNMLYAFGIGEIAISISGADTTSFAHTVRAVGAVSAAIARADAGAMIGLRGPFGKGWPIAQAEGADVVIVAGGLGLAPLRPAIHAILANRERFGRIFILIGSRSPDDILFRQDLMEWRQRLDVEVEVTVDHAGIGWHGHVGVVTSLIARAGFDPDDCIAMLCGPEVMMRFAAAALTGAGVPSRSIYLSMERNMKCAVGLCGRCQFGPTFICKDGPVLRHDAVGALMATREI